MKGKKHCMLGAIVLLTIAPVSSGDRTGQITVLADAATTENAMKPQTPAYQFGPASFTTEWWIDSKRVFKKPAGVDVEVLTSPGFDWVFADANGKEVRTLHSDHGGGWTSMDFSSLGLYQDYSIGFRNTSSGEMKIKQGEVRFR